MTTKSDIPVPPSTQTAADNERIDNALAIMFWRGVVAERVQPATPFVPKEGWSCSDAWEEDRRTVYPTQEEAIDSYLDDREARAAERMREAHLERWRTVDPGEMFEPIADTSDLIDRAATWLSDNTGDDEVDVRLREGAADELRVLLYDWARRNVISEHWDMTSSRPLDEANDVPATADSAATKGA